MFEFLQRVFERIGDGMVWGMHALNNFVNSWEDDYEKTARFAVTVKGKTSPSPNEEQGEMADSENSDTDSDDTIMKKDSRNVSPVCFALDEESDKNELNPAVGAFTAKNGRLSPNLS